MAENNRNQSDQYNQDWNDDRNRHERQKDNRRQGEYGHSGDESQGNNYGNMNSDYEGGYGQTGYGNRRHDQDWKKTGSLGNSSGQDNNWQSNRGNFSEDYYQGRSGKGSQHENTFGKQDGYRGYDGRQDQYRGNDSYSGRWDKTRGGSSSSLGNEHSENRGENDRIGGSHRGKGPKDYQRSENRIREDVCDRLSDDAELDASNIQVHVQNNEVILTGTVENRQQKRHAEDLVESISGVKHVENRLRVGRTDDFNLNQYTGTTDQIGGIGNESGTTNEIIRNVRNKE